MAKNRVGLLGRVRAGAVAVLGAASIWDIYFAVGVVLVGVGAALIFVPAGFIVVGLLFLLTWWRGAWGS